MTSNSHSRKPLWRIILPLSIVLLILASSIVTRNNVSTAVNPATLVVTPTTLSLHPLDSFTTNITLDSMGWPVRTIGIDLQYPLSIFQVTTMTYAGLLGPPSQVLMVGGDGTAGHISCGISRQPGNIPQPVNGTLYTITWNTSADPGVYTLDLEGTVIDNTGQAIPLGFIGDSTITLQAYPSMDLNQDGKINILDLIMIAQHWEETGIPGWIPHDLNQDGQINILDLILVAQHWTG